MTDRRVLSMSGDRSVIFVVALAAIIASACQGATATATVAPTEGPSQATSTATATASVASAAFADMPMYRMDPTHQGVQPGPGPEGQPQLAWSVKAGGPIESSPILANDTLFFGSDDGYLYALDPRTGADRWRLDLGAPAPASPAFDAGVVVVVDRSGILHGVNATTGIEAWRTAAVANPAPPALADGIVYVTGSDHKVHGFDVQTGAEQWSWTTSGSLNDPLAVGAGSVYTSTDDGVVHAIALTGATESWHQQLDSTAVGYPIISGDVVLVNILQGPGEPSGQLYGLDRADGHLLWRFRAPSGLQVSMGSVRDGILYAPTQSDGIYAFRVADGTQVWHATGPTVFFPTALVDDTLYMTAESPPQIAAVKASDGSALWALPMADIPKGNPVVTGGMLFAADSSGEVRAYAGSGTVAGVIPSDPRPLPAPSATPVAENPFSVVDRWTSLSLGLDRPIALAIGPNGDAYVTETSNRVSRIAPDGSVVSRWGTEGSKEGEFDFVGANLEDGAHASIAVGPDGKVYISDSDNHRVQVFTADGHFVRQFGSFGQADGQFAGAFDLGVDADGNVYVIDDAIGRLSKWGPDGAFLWAVSGATDKELEGHLHGANLDPNGRIVVSVDDTGRVVYLDRDGKVVDVFDAAACEVTVDPSGNTFVADAACGGGQVKVFDPSHGLIGSWSGEDMSLAAAPEFGPADEILALDRDGGIVKLKVTIAP